MMFFRLPRELIAEILSYLLYKDLALFSCCNKDYYYNLIVLEIYQDLAKRSLPLLSDETSDPSLDHSIFQLAMMYRHGIGQREKSLNQFKAMELFSILDNRCNNLSQSRARRRAQWRTNQHEAETRRSPKYYPKPLDMDIQQPEYLTTNEYFLLNTRHQSFILVMEYFKMRKDGADGVDSISSKIPAGHRRSLSSQFHHYLLSGGHRSELYLTDIVTGQRIQTYYNPHYFFISTLLLVLELDLVVYATSSSTIYVYDLWSGTALLEIRSAFIPSINPKPDYASQYEPSEGDYGLSGMFFRSLSKLQSRDPVTGEIIYSLLAGCKDGSIRIWQLSKLVQEARSKQTVSSPATSPDVNTSSEPEKGAVAVPPQSLTREEREKRIAAKISAYEAELKSFFLMSLDDTSSQVKLLSGIHTHTEIVPPATGTTNSGNTPDAGSAGAEPSQPTITEVNPGITRILVHPFHPDIVISGDRTGRLVIWRILPSHEDYQILQRQVLFSSSSSVFAIDIDTSAPYQLIVQSNAEDIAILQLIEEGSDWTLTKVSTDFHPSGVALLSSDFARDQDGNYRTDYLWTSAANRKFREINLSLPGESRLIRNIDAPSKESNLIIRSLTNRLLLIGGFYCTPRVLYLQPSF